MRVTKRRSSPVSGTSGPTARASSERGARSPGLARRLRLAAVASLLGVVAVASVGCGGGGGGDGIDDGPAAFGVPFVATSGSRDMFIGLRNLDDSSVTVELTGYHPDGTPYSPPVFVTIDALDEEFVDLTDALADTSPDGGVVLVKTPTRRVEAYFDVTDSGGLEADASRAFALPDLDAPPPGPFSTGVDSTTETTSIQIVNASPVAATIAVTAFEESLAFPAAAPVAHDVVLAPFAPFESRIFTPDDLSGISGFTGSFFLESPSPVMGASEEDLAFAVPRTATRSRTAGVAVSYGRDPRTVLPTYLDFALVVRNDSDSARVISITRISRDVGSAIYSAQTSPARSIALAAHEARTVLTTDPPFDDLFGDPLATATLTRLWIDLSIPDRVDVGVRQFDPQFLVSNTNLVPTPTGHVMIVSDVFPEPILPSPFRTFVALMNPTASPITVFAESLTPEPSGFDATPRPLVTLGAGVTSITIPAFGRVDVSPDGATYLDRDLAVVDHVGLRFRSNAPFSASAWREERDGADGVETLIALPVRSLDDGE